MERKHAHPPHWLNFTTPDGCQNPPRGFRLLPGLFFHAGLEHQHAHRVAQADGQGDGEVVVVATVARGVHADLGRVVAERFQCLACFSLCLAQQEFQARFTQALAGLVVDGQRQFHVLPHQLVVQSVHDHLVHGRCGKGWACKGQQGGGE